jgi:hypothetical protein
VAAAAGPTNLVLRQHGREVERRKLLDVVYEMRIDDGLEVFAACSDGRVRCFNHTGMAAIVEDGPETVGDIAGKWTEAAQVAAQRTGPSERPRQPPPEGDTLRLTLIVSDGLYIGDGPGEALQADARGRPLIRWGLKLGQAIWDAGPSAADQMIR